MIEVSAVLPDSPAARAGISVKDRIIAVNGEEVGDVLDFLFLSEGEGFRLTLKDVSGRLRTAKIEKRPGEPSGLHFPPLHIRRCRNRCIFCFVDQMPNGLRKSLYIKDDDYRASFLYGNYITLSNFTSSDRKRIMRQRLSPLYISVHATEPGLRSFILGNPNAPDIMEEMRRLASAGIRMHTQIVLCPGINDGPQLERTVNDLAGLYPHVMTAAVVPVGLTIHRKGLFPLKTFTRQHAAQVTALIEGLGRQFMKRLGTRFVFCSDELYIKGGSVIPSALFYEDFSQIENGVGMVAWFMREARRVRIPSSVRPMSITLVTGFSFHPILKSVIHGLSRIKGLRTRLIAVKNRFFGPSVTVAGLLTGRDIIESLRGKRLGDVLILPRDAVREEGDELIDGTTLREIEETLSVKISLAEGFRDVVRIITSG